MLVNEADQRIKELLGLITPAPWYFAKDYYGGNSIRTTLEDGSNIDGRTAVWENTGRGSGDMSPEEAEFIALVRNRIGSLLEERETLRLDLLDSGAMRSILEDDALRADDERDEAREQLAQAKAEGERLREALEQSAILHRSGERPCGCPACEVLNPQEAYQKPQTTNMNLWPDDTADTVEVRSKGAEDA